MKKDQLCVCLDCLSKGVSRNTSGEEMCTFFLVVVKFYYFE